MEIKFGQNKAIDRYFSPKRVLKALAIIGIFLFVLAIVGYLIIAIIIFREEKKDSESHKNTQNILENIQTSSVPNSTSSTIEVKNFDDCVAAGYQYGYNWCITPNDDFFEREVQVKSLSEIVLFDGKIDLNDWDVKEIKVGKWGDSRLILINRNTKKEENLINSTFELRDYLWRQNFINRLLGEDGALWFAGYSRQNNELYFVAIYEISGPVFGLDINSHRIKRIKSLDYDSSVVFYPQGDRAILLADYPATTLSLVCFNNDTKTPIVNLKNGETFEQKVRERDAYFDIKWVDERNIEYNVYKNEAKNYADENSFIRTETTSLPDCN
jgi:hypothetical protein